MPIPKQKLIPGIFLLLVAAALAAPPLWWSQGNPPVIVPGAPANHHGPANIGQAKHMAQSALDALREVIPATADAIESDLVGPGKIIPSWNPPVTQAERDKNHAPLLIGQLKAISHPFYQHLHAAAPYWLAAQRSANGTESGGIFPWTTATSDDNNHGMANTGQLKAVFALDFDRDADSDGMSDLWEENYAGILLELEITPAQWGAHHADLQSGDLQPNVAYTADGITAGQLASWAPLKGDLAIEIEKKTFSQQRYYGETYFPNPNDFESFTAHILDWTASPPIALDEPDPTSVDLPGTEEGYVQAAVWGQANGEIIRIDYPGPPSFPFGSISLSNAVGESKFGTYERLDPGVNLEQWKFGSKTGSRVRFWRQVPLSQPTTLKFLEITKEHDLNNEEDAVGEYEIVAANPVIIEIPANQIVSSWHEIDTTLAEDKQRVASLLPVDIKVVKEGETTAPEDGLVVKKTDTVRYRLSPGMPDTPLLLEDKIQWHWRILKWDGKYSEWTPYEDGQGHTFTAQPEDAGIYEVKATVEGQDFFLKRAKDDPHSAKKKDENECFGVVEQDWQINVRNQAKANLGSVAYATNAKKPPLGVADNKCNLFVAHMATAGGATVPWINFGLTSFTFYPPVANQWEGTDPKVIPNWILLPVETYPQPGFIVAKIGAVEGHCGILDYDGSRISAGPKNVNRKADIRNDISLRSDNVIYQPAKFRKYNP